MSTESVITVANSLLANHSKTELINMARAMGWRGDHARTPILVFALFVASKTAEDTKQPKSSLKHEGAPEGEDQQGEKSEGQGEGKGEQGEDQKGDVPSWAKPEQSEQGENSGEQPKQPEQGDSEQGENSGEQPKHPEQGESEQQQRENEQARQQMQQRDGAQQPAQQRQRDDKAEAEPTPESSQKQPQQPSERDSEEDDSPQEDKGDEFEQLLKASGLKQPHRLLEKVWRLTVKGKLNVMLSGPAGAGKTTLAHQLSQLLSVPFASVSCTAGMSESQLTGWLLPVGDNGRFDYVPSPFIRAIQEPSVFLLDELDAADANVVLAMNSLLANGFLTVSHKLDNPTVMRQERAVIIAGVNSVGGGDDVYTARTILDGSTLDRFYIMPIDYDESYESELFNKSKRAGRKSPKWQKSTAVIDQTVSDQLKQYFFGVRRIAEKSQIRQIVSTRFAQKLMAACEAGIPVQEVKSDLLSAWTTDERAHVAKLGA